MGACQMEQRGGKKRNYWDIALFPFSLFPLPPFPDLLKSSVQMFIIDDPYFSWSQALADSGEEASMPVRTEFPPACCCLHVAAFPFLPL